MKAIRWNHAILAIAFLAFHTWNTNAEPVGTTFTYQGHLRHGTAPASGTYDFRFSLYDDSSGGSPVGSIVTNSGVDVVGGLFTVPLDFGAGVFNGDARWLEMAVRTNGVAEFSTLNPRQPLRPAPYAQYTPIAGLAVAATTAESAAVADTVLDGAITGPKIADGAVGNAQIVSNAVTSANIADGTITDADIATISGDKIQGGDLQSWRLKVGQYHILLGSASTIAGGSGNTISNALWSFESIGGGQSNCIENATGASIAGGSGNSISNAGWSPDAIGGGQENWIQGAGNATIAGGHSNLIAGSWASTVAGGSGNAVFGQGEAAAIGGGMDNMISNSFGGTIPGGISNQVNAAMSFAAGYRANANHPGTFVWADSTEAEFVSGSSNQFLIRAIGGVGVGTNNPQGALHVVGDVIANSFTGSGAGLTSLAGAALAPGTVGSEALANGAVYPNHLNEVLLSNTFWRLDGNAGTTPGTHFLGTTDDRPLEFRVGNERVLRIEKIAGAGYESVNLVAGSIGNFLTPGLLGATVAGGGAWAISLDGGNGVSADFGTIGGGVANRIASQANASTISGGEQNVIDDTAAHSVVDGGILNRIGTNAAYASIGGGASNTVDAIGGTVAGGEANVVTSVRSPGGYIFVNSSDYACIAGGRANLIQPGLGGGFYSSPTNSAIGGGYANTLYVPNSVIGGGIGNAVGQDNSDLYEVGHTLSGGVSNSIGYEISHATLGGGLENFIDSTTATIAGGEHNLIDWAGWFVRGNTISGGAGNEIHSNPGYSVISGGASNTNHSSYGAIGGGVSNFVSGEFATVPGGQNNSATSYALAAGRRAKANHTGAFVWADSTDADFASTGDNQFLIRASGGVGIGTTNPASRLTVAGSGAFDSMGAAAILLTNNSAQGRGWQWHALDNGRMQLSDYTLGASGTRMVIDTNGRVGIGTANPTDKLHVSAGITCTVLTQTSDRNAKEEFASVSPLEVLAKVAALPITTWKFKDMQDGRHMGPMAQDFYSAFSLGNSDTKIAAVDSAGVALAAIQGLNQRLEEQAAENAELKRELAELKQLIKSQTSNPNP